VYWWLSAPFCAVEFRMGDAIHIRDVLAELRLMRPDLWEGRQKRDRRRADPRGTGDQSPPIAAAVPCPAVLPRMQLTFFPVHQTH
jgi:hypothetical protein